MIDPIFASCTLIAVFVVLLAMGAPIDLHRYRLFQHHDAGTAFRYFDVRHRAKNVLQPDSFALLAVPFFVLSGVIMNSGELPPGWSILPNCLLANCPARSLIPTSSAI